MSNMSNIDQAKLKAMAAELAKNIKTQSDLANLSGIYWLDAYHYLKSLYLIAGCKAEMIDFLQSNQEAIIAWTFTLMLARPQKSEKKCKSTNAREWVMWLFPKYNVGVATATKWAKRDTSTDKSHRPPKLRTDLKSIQGLSAWIYSHRYQVLTKNARRRGTQISLCCHREPTGQHIFDQVCKAFNIEHRLTKPRHPQTNGMVERFHGRISQLLGKHNLDHYNT